MKTVYIMDLPARISHAIFFPLGGSERYGSIYLQFEIYGEKLGYFLRNIRDYQIDKGLFKSYRKNARKPKGIITLDILSDGDGYVDFVSDDHKELHIKFDAAQLNGSMPKTFKHCEVVKPADSLRRMLESKEV